MTFNIRYGTANDGPDHWDARKGQVVEFLRRHQPDVVGLQEALRFQIDEIRGALPEYAEVGVGRDDGAEAGEYSPILYRKTRFRPIRGNTFWFSDSPDVPGSRTWGNRYARVCTWVTLEDSAASRRFTVYNVHLDHESQPSREKSAILLSRAIRSRVDPGPVVVTGDFNAGEQNLAVRIMRGEVPEGFDIPGDERVRLLDSFRVLHPDAVDVGTFHAFRGRRTGEKIDHVFVAPGTRVRAAAIHHDNENNRYPSDHFAVSAEIVFPPP